MNISEVEERIRRDNVSEIALQFVGMSGILHSLWVPADLFASVAEQGIHTDGSSLSQVVDVSKSDLNLIPDLDSFVVLPAGLFPQRIARVVCDVYEPESHKPFELDPRYVLKKLVGEVKKSLGESVDCYTASEIEYFLLQRNEMGGLELYDQGSYLATPPADRGAELRFEMAEALRSVGIVIEKHHHEVPPSKNEFNIKYAPAIQMADTVYLVKFIVKFLAAKRGLVASFMPKPFHGEYGAGLHTHISIFDDDAGVNLFAGADVGHGLSETGLSFLAGILHHARALAGVTNPSVNSYKRLVPGWEAPVNISWSKYNRSVLIRIPPGRGKGTRLEYRPTDGSCNFYLAYAALIAAGLDGIDNSLAPPDPVEEDIYKMTPAERANRGIDVLPGNLGEALHALSGDATLRERLGGALFDKFIEIKTKEWMDFSTVVHEWERERYLDV